MNTPIETAQVHDSVYWFNQTATERVETARRVSNQLRFAGRLEDFLNGRFLEPLEEVVRRDGVAFVEFTPGGLRIGSTKEKDITEFRFFVERLANGHTLRISLLRIRNEDSNVCSSWTISKAPKDNWSMMDIADDQLAHIAQAAGTALADATYQQETGE